MYLVKLKQKDSNVHGYANNSIIVFKDQLEEYQYDKSHFLLSKEDSHDLMMRLISRNRTEFNLEYISVVRATTYKPHTEVEVIFYREFK